MPDDTSQKIGMTVNEAARRLEVHRNTILIWIKTRQLRAVKLGRKWRIMPEDLQTFLDKRANIEKERPAA